ncbi:MAG: radical SAM family heme chaperone HemW [Verrucomicrobiales bacterium]|nr:radical SAM family heme chaperone HemW [Verrucomicrobiales bacterium]
MEGVSPIMASSVYVHVPFCARKCAYCAFYSTAAEGELVHRYVEALAREIASRPVPRERPLKTVFFGGGTPSLLSLRQWERVLDAAAAAGWLGAAEWTVECNPATVSEDKARLLRERGVNRISMGVQSLDEGLLDRLGRVHSRDMVFRSFDVLRRAGFDNLNLDLMFGIPGQTMDHWRGTLREAIALGSEHLSCYEVIYEEDTALFDELKAGEFEVDEALNAEMFEALVADSAAAGFRQYEVANFARDRTPAPWAGLPADHPAVPSHACQHNLNYWLGGSYAALGPSASGYEGGRRYRNLSSTAAYCEAVERGALPREWSEELPPLARAGEIAAFGLRMNAGWPWAAFEAATGFDLRSEWQGEMSALQQRGWGAIESDRFRLTPDGLRFADAAGSEFLRGGDAEVRWERFAGKPRPVVGGVLS